MFTKEDYKKLDAMWDGIFNDSKEPSACVGCGACCSNTTKTLYPGELEYLTEQTGQINNTWASSGCLCYRLGGKIKPVICKVFPLEFKVALDKTTVEIDWEIPVTTYSKRCKDLYVSEERKPQIQAYLDFLFSDVHNRVFHLLEFTLQDYMEQDKKYVRSLGKNLRKEEYMERGAYGVLGLPVKEIFTHFVF